MNTAFVVGSRLADVFSKHGLCIDIQAVANAEDWDFGRWEGEGVIAGLPRYVMNRKGESRSAASVEVAIASRRESELAQCGLMALCDNQQSTAFLSAVTCHRPRKAESTEITVNDVISSRLPCVMVASRFAHYVRLITHDALRRLPDEQPLVESLARWIKQYVSGVDSPSDDARSRFPLASARVEIREESNGQKRMVLWLRPHGELITGDLTAEIPIEVPLP